MEDSSAGITLKFANGSPEHGENAVEGVCFVSKIPVQLYENFLGPGDKSLPV